MIPEYLADVVTTGAEVSIIAEPRQVIIDCRGCAIDDRHLASIARDPNLTWLCLFECDVSNEGVLRLSGKPELEYIDVGSTRVDGSILRIVPSLPALGGIGLKGVQHINANIDFLKNHPMLDMLDLSFSDVTACELCRLLVNSRVTGVDVRGTGITASDVEALDDLDAEPYRTVSIRLSETERVAIVMELK